MNRIPAWRAALRLARRDAWRNKGRSALVAIMIALPVLAASAVSVVYRSDVRDPQDVVAVALGRSAQAMVASGGGAGVISQSIDGSSWGSASSNGDTVAEKDVGADIAAVVSPRDRVVPQVSSYGETRNVRFGDRRLSLTAVRELNYAQTGLALFDQVSGRAPAAPGEVVVSRHVAQERGIRPGARLTYGPARSKTPRSLTVVGVVGGTALLDGDEVIGRPGDLIPPAADGLEDSSRSWFVVGPDPVTWDQVLDLNQRGAAVTSRGVVENPPPKSRVPYEQDSYDGGSSQAAVWATAVIVVGLALLQIALLAGPAIAVGARRNQRGLAIMASTGAERRDLQAVVLATNGVIGLVASAVAAVAGGGIGVGIVLGARRWFDYPVVRVDLRPLDLLGLVLVGAFTAIGAALIPARQAARLDVVAALTGRRGYGSPRRRVPVAGLLIAVAGLALAFYAASAGNPFLCVAGMALTEIGLVAAVGGIVSLVARGAHRLPFAARFALRDAARQRSRTAPAVAAVMAAVAGGTAALVFVASQAHHDEQQYVAQSAPGVIMMAGDQLDAKGLGTAESTLRGSLPIGSVARVRAVGNDPAHYVFVSPDRPPANTCPENAAPADPRCAENDGWLGPSIGPWFDDGSALQIYVGQRLPADVAALRAGKVVVFDPLDRWPDGTVHLNVEQDPRPGSGSTEPVTRKVVLPAQVSQSAHPLTDLVLPASAEKAIGAGGRLDGLVANTTRPVTGAEEDKAQAAMTDAVGTEFSVERGYENNYTLGLLALVGAAAIVTLAGTFTAVGLAAAEGRADVATLAAVGAAPAVRRRLAAAQAGVISGLGAVLGLGSGILAGWLLVLVNRATLYISPGSSDWALQLPWPHLLAVGVGVPLLAVLVGFLTTRSRFPLVRRLGQ